MTALRHRMRSRGRWLAWITAIVVVLWPALAAAHASLVASDPASEAVLATSPTTFSLTFNEPVTALLLQLIDARGRSQAITAIDQDGATLRFAPPALLSEGAHVLSWRVISADGHPIGGALTFWIGTPGQRLPPIVVPDDPVRRAAIWGTRITVDFTLLTAVGGAVFLGWIATVPVAGMMTAGLALLGLAAVVLSAGLQGLDALDLPLARLGDAAVWRAGASGSFGDAATLSGLALVLALAALRWRGWNARLLSLGAVVSLGTAFAVSGHAATAEPRSLSGAAVWVHGVSLALWIGALLPLAIAVGRRDAAPAPLRRFSKAIPLAIVALLISGIALAAIELGRIDALWQSDYGRVLIAKLALVVVLLALALWNRVRLTPLLLAGEATAVRRMRASIAAELVLVIAILGVVGLWRFTPPPRSAVSQSTAPSEVVHLHTERAMATVTLAPARAGPVEIEVLLQTADEALLAAQALTVTLANPAAGIEPLSAEARKTADGPWRARLTAPVPGTWTLTLGILISDFEKVNLEAPIVIR
ncbi:copper resistance CopC/CopD family protein [Rhodopseudomonas palustris]|uniref:CopD family protein n=2 Tax=Rhodopseudomonas palustris (strain ATCC BAA-98 / CGA009) TaxID=258594 RepID=A0AAF0BNR0_RHOPA|nr:CopD family protein [Rhodopseudomonas palustris]WAB75850.1 CopD family protein [Rhodopseudomonas palustris]WCL93100.1 CopD family protein [Rhodopseudomonas palustris CGA009]WND49759.1 copper resistance protein CopC/CopD [Rhodopseudomonas palustris]